MENIIASNLNFVKRVITSKVEANRGHTRFILADNIVKVKFRHNKYIDMRYLILTDEESCLNIINHNACLTTGNGQFCLKNSEQIYGENKSPRKKINSETLSDGDFRAVPSCLLGSTSSMALHHGTSEFSNKIVYTIGFDTEWVEGKNGRRHILSYQLSQYFGEGSFRVLIEFILFPDGHRLSDSTLFSVYTQILRDQLGIDIGPTASNYQEKVHVFLVPHYSIADLSTFYNSKEILRNTDTIRRTQTTVQKPLFVNVWDKHYNYKQLWVVKVRDTMHLSPSGSSLEQLASAMDKLKLKLPDKYNKEGMDILLKEQPDEFILYACNDATLALQYVNSMYPDKDIPITLGSEGADVFRESIMEINDWKVKDFDYYFRGMVTIKDDNGRKKLEGRKEAVPALEIANHCYYGGRNECYLYGIHKADVWYDYDLTGAYPTSMSLLRNPDFDRITVLTGDIVSINPLDYVFGLVDFEFPPDTPFPCLPIKDPECRGLVFPLKGRTYASAPELYLALKLGAKVKWVQFGIQVGTLEKYDIQEALTDLLKARAEAKRIFGKGSVQEVKLKEQINSIYGKTAQGLSKKRSYSTRTDSVNDLPPSAITQPILAAMTTSIVRAIVTAAMHQLYKMGYRIASVTTDGFLCDAPPEVLNDLSLYGFKHVYKAVRGMMVSDDTMWEIKHKAKVLVMITTRGGFGVGIIGDNSPLPVAKAGYKPPAGFVERFKNKVSEELSKLFLRRTGKIEMGFNKLPSPRDYIRKNADGLSVFQKKRIEWEYDLKRKPNNMWEDSITIDGETYKHLSFDTVPWQTWEEFNDARIIKKNHPELYPLKSKEKADMLMAMIRDKEATRKAGMIIQSADKGGIYRTATISYLRSILSDREPMPTWMKGLSYKQLAEAFNERLQSLNVTLSVDDFKKAKQRSNKGRLENSEALEIVKRLLI
jgi:hypothetical protein